MALWICCRAINTLGVRHTTPLPPCASSAHMSSAAKSTSVAQDTHPACTRQVATHQKGLVPYAYWNGIFRKCYALLEPPKEWQVGCFAGHAVPGTLVNPDIALVV